MIFLKKRFGLRRIAARDAALLISLCGAVQFYAHSLPDHFYTDADRPLSVETVLPVTFAHRAPTVPQAQDP